MLADKLKDLPDAPGVYIMHDATGKVIYVGKAVVLKNRVRQYFQNTEKPVKVQAMVDNIADFEYIITRTEKDALALENNLIKKYKPYYNILLKDDKTSPYIRVDVKKEFPCIEVTRRVKRDGARYFGPFIGVSVKDVIAVLQSAYKLRTCAGALKKRSRPCLDYDIGLCLAPCCGLCDRDEYAKALNKAMSFLSGGSDDVSDVITQKMNDAAREENFERAIMYRNQLKVLANLKSKVVGALGNTYNIDAFYYTDNGLFGAVSVCIVRGGKMMGVKNFIIGENCVLGDISSFLPQYYSMTNELPDEICVQSELDFAPLEDYFDSVFGKRPTITAPQKGLKKKLLDTAANNCSDFLLKSVDREKRERDMTLGACERLQKLFSIPSARRIECYDISDISGEDKVASQVVFINGRAERDLYRRYRIRTVEGADDFRSMYETLVRRFLRYKSNDAGFDELPDLIVIDGGAEQVEFASRAADDVGIAVKIVGLAKKDEEIYVRGDKTPIKLMRDDYGLKLMQRVRDEAHRFAVLYHRTVRAKRYESELKGVAGVGDATVRKVLEAFGTNTIVTATAREIAQKAGINVRAAQNIYDYYHPESAMKSNALKYKLIASDMDGTLLDDELNISERNLAAINEFRARGGIFTIATGRSAGSLKKYAHILGIDEKSVKAVCQLGCMIVDTATLEAEAVFGIENSVASELIATAAPQCEIVQLYDVEGMATENITENAMKYYSALGLEPYVTDNLAEYAKNSEKTLVKVILILDARKIEEVCATLSARFKGISFVRSTAPVIERLKREDGDFIPAMLECISDKADKGRGVKWIADHYGISMKEVMTLGDSFNDVDMLKVAGLGVAMGNASEPIKIAADCVAPDNNSDGVAYAIEKFCLNG